MLKRDLKGVRRCSPVLSADSCSAPRLCKLHWWIPLAGVDGWRRIVAASRMSTGSLGRGW